MTNNWKFNKEVSLGDMVAIMIAIGGVFAAYFTLKSEIELLRARIMVEESSHVTIKSEIYERLNRIEDKLDRLVERNTRIDK